MKKLGTLFLIITLIGCAKLKHLNQLLTLKDYAQEQDNISQYIKQQRDNVDRLLNVVKEGKLDQYPDKKSIIKEFGEPVIERTVTKGGLELDECLYRYATKYFGTEKVYIYFDFSGKLIESKYIPAETKIM